jgi:glycerol-1-phosphate dehydrogenase [NAD(P)+]
MELPRRVVVGTSVIQELGRLISELDLGDCSLIVSGQNVRKALDDSVSASLSGAGYKFSWETVSAPSFPECERITRLAKKQSASLLIGIGGGKSIDVAKLASFNCRLPFVSVPTSASHDGISSPFASLRGLDRPYSVVAKPPVAIIADTNVIAGAPPRLLISGCGDLVSKRTAVRDWELASVKRNEYFGKYAASLAMLSADLVIGSSTSIGKKEKDSVRVVVEALISAGVAAGIAGSSRPCSGSEHLFSHAMEIVAPGKGLHGEKCGIGTIMMASLHGLDSDEIRNALSAMGAPTNSRGISATSDEVVKALEMAGTLRKDRYTILNEAKLDESSARQLARSAGVISD